MTGETATTCATCGRAVDPAPAVVDEGRAYCSAGCRDVAAVLGHPFPADEDASDPDGRPASDVHAGGDGTDESGPRSDRQRVRSYFRVDGMHSATCEAFLETVAEARPGVLAADASYVTRTVRVEHRPEDPSPEELRDALSTHGYTAYRRDGDRDVEPDVATADSDPNDRVASTGSPAGGPIERRELGGPRKRRTDELLGFRYVVGVVFGTFMLLPYVALLYPTYLAELYPSEFLRIYQGAFETGFQAVVLRVFLVLTLLVLLFTGLPTLRRAFVSLRMRRPNTDVLAAMAALGALGYGTVAVYLGRNDVYYDLTVAIAALATAATYYEATVKRRAMDRLVDLTISQVDTARRVLDDGTVETVPVGAVEAGDRIEVPAGERIPVDGVLVEGPCTVDEAVVTGESLPVGKRPGERVVGGSVVVGDGALVRAGERADSRLAAITRDVWDLQSTDHGVQRRANALAARLAPAILVVALAAGVLGLALGGDAPVALLWALGALFVVCPWALSLATPLSVATTIEEALDRGIVVFDETLLERLRDIDVVVFDKTGTLTTGEMAVHEVAGDRTALAAAAALERRSSHPAARAIVRSFTDDGEAATVGPTGVLAAASPADPEDPGTGSDGPSIAEVRTHATGVEGTVDGAHYLVGHPDLLAERDWRVPDELAERAEAAAAAGRMPVLVGRDGVGRALVVLGDEPRPGWERTLEALDRRGIDVVVLTGDGPAAAEAYRRHPAVDHVFAGVSPAGKTAAIRRLGVDRRVAMVGDGTNDAPAIAAADLGISLGGGTALAADAADLAVLGEDLEGVETAFALAGAAGRRVRRTLRFALAYNAIVLPLALVGVLNPLLTMVALLVTVLLLSWTTSRPLLNGSPQRPSVARGRDRRGP